MSKWFITPPDPISRANSIDSVSPTRGQHSQQQSGEITLQLVLINKPEFVKATRHSETGKNQIPRSMVVEVLNWRSRRANQHPGVQSPVHIPEKCPTNLAHSPLFVGPCRKKTDHGHISFSLRNLPVRAFDSCAQGFSTPLARRRSSYLPTSPNLVRTHPIERYQALRNSTPCLSSVTTSRKAPNWRLEEARTSGIPSSTNHTAGRVSTDRLNREDSQLAASLEGEPGHTPAGKTLPHSYPKTRFRRERARDYGESIDTFNMPTSYHISGCGKERRILIGPW